MGKTDFDEFVDRELGEVGSQPTVDWDQEKKNWLNQLGRFFKDVRAFVQDYVDSGKMSIAEDTIELHEKGIGIYRAPMLTMSIGRHTVRLSPKGMNVIAAHGRVDMEGEMGSVQFVLVPKDADGPSVQVRIYDDGEPISPDPAPSEPPDLAWKLLARVPTFRFVPLDKDVFLDAFMEVVNA